MIQFTCKNCNEPLEAPESLAGNMLVCPQCKISQWVPGQPAKTDAIAPVQIASPPREDKPYQHKSDSTLWVVLYSVGGLFFSFACGGVSDESGGSFGLSFALAYGCLMLLGIFISLGCLMAWSAKQANILERIAWQQDKKKAE